MTSSGKPNVVLFVPDEMRADVMGHLGHPSGITPRLDALAASEAVSFERAFCQNPVCTPSRCSFMSGWYPHVRGHRIQHHMMKRDEPVLLRDLKRSGYRVLWAGKNDLIPGDADFSEYCDIKHQAGPEVLNLHRDQSWRAPEGHPHHYSFLAGDLDASYPRHKTFDEDNVEAAVQFISTAAGEEQPFCVYLPLFYPHPPYASSEPWLSAVDPASIPPLLPPVTELKDKPAALRAIRERQNTGDLPEEEFRRIRSVYLSMVNQIDAQFGQVVDALKEAEIYEDTLILFFSDHGDFAGDYGLVEKTQNTFEDCLTRVPLVMKPPRSHSVSPGVRSGLAELVDIPATVADICGLKPEHPHFGRSLVPFLEEDRPDHRDAVFCEGGRLRGETQAMELESTEDQIPGGLYWPRLSIQREAPVCHGKAVMVRTGRYKYVHRLYEQDELYDLKTDPGELANRIADPGLESVRRELKDRLLQFFMETGDAVPLKPDPR